MEYEYEYGEVDGEPFAGWVEVQCTDDGDQGDYLTPPYPPTFEVIDGDVWLLDCEDGSKRWRQRAFTNSSMKAKAVGIMSKWAIEQAGEGE